MKHKNYTCPSYCFFGSSNCKGCKFESDMKKRICAMQIRFKLQDHAMTEDDNKWTSHPYGCTEKDLIGFLDFCKSRGLHVLLTGKSEYYENCFKVYVMR